jgi:hypothetical protein
LFVDIFTFWLLCTVYYYAVVSDLRQVGGFSLGSSTNKTDRHDITELLLKVALGIFNHNHNLLVIAREYNISV